MQRVLTENEFNGLSKIAQRTNQKWFGIARGKFYDWVYDSEEKENLSLDIAICLLAECLSKKGVSLNNLKDYGLSSEEDEAVKALLETLNIVLN